MRHTAKNYFFICQVLILTACLSSCKEDKPPKNLLPKEKFATLIMEFSIEEATYSRLIDVDTAALNSLALRNAQVLKKHDVTRQQFLDTYSYYNRHKNELAEVYDLSLELLMKRMDEVRTRKDSIQ